jgi:hypothetical protein
MPIYDVVSRVFIQYIRYKIRVMRKISLLALANNARSGGITWPFFEIARNVKCLMHASTYINRRLSCPLVAR